MFVWDEKKREANLNKHKPDFADAWMVYDHPIKLTRRSLRHKEERNVDIAVVEVTGLCLTLIYVKREADIRVISFRTASRRERKLYASYKPD